MNCSYCKVEMEKRHATREQPYCYRQSGLRELFLHGIDVYLCPKCNVEVPVIPRVAQLYATLADGIVKRTRLLRGDEIRFLRKHAGLPAQDFAQLIGVTPEHLSRVENGHTKSFGKNTDRLVRAFTLTAKKGPEARKILLALAASFDAKKSGRKRGEIIDRFYSLDSHGGWKRTGS
jgi:transcriptional regulator with XRE-family HTH domain